MPKVDDRLTKPKPQKSLNINLNNNVTYAFQKVASVADMMAPDHQSKAEVRKTLPVQAVQKSILKTSLRRSLAPSAVHTDKAQIVKVGGDPDSDLP